MAVLFGGSGKQRFDCGTDDGADECLKLCDNLVLDAADGEPRVDADESTGTRNR